MNDRGRRRAGGKKTHPFCRVGAFDSLRFSVLVVSSNTSSGNICHFKYLQVLFQKKSLQCDPQIPWLLK